MPAPAASEAAIRRALAAAQSCGIAVASFRVLRDGTVEIVAAAATASANGVDSRADNVQPIGPKAWKRPR